MKQKHLVLPIFFLFCSIQFMYAQAFQGIIHYKIHHEVKKGITHRTVWKETQGNYMDYYTDGCSNRTSYRYNDTVLWSEVYDCASHRVYLVYPNVDQVLWHEITDTDTDIKIEVTGFEENVMEILGVPCDRMIIEQEYMSQKEKTEYFLSRQHHLSQDALAFDALLANCSDERVLSIPLAVVTENDAYMKANEAIEIIPHDSLPKDLFLPPANSKLIPNGLRLETPPQPKKGYDWWYQKIYSSMRYPYKAFKEGRDEHVMVMFAITEEGKMADIAVVNEVDADFKLYVVKYLQSMVVRWKPGIRDGKPITSALVLPVTFLR